CSPSSETGFGYRTACSCWTWSGVRTCTSSRVPSMCTSGACASGSNGMMLPRNSSSRSAVLDTSSTPTRWSRRLALQFLVPALAALAGALVVAAPWLWTRLERQEIDTLRDRLTTGATLVGDAVPWTEGAPREDTGTSLSTD